MLDHDCDILPARKHSFFFFFLTSTNDQEVLCACCVCYLPCFFFCFFLIEKWQTFLSIRGHVYKAFIYEQLAGPLCSAPVWRWLGGLSEISRRATPFHLFSFSSADFRRVTSRARKPSMTWERILLFFFFLFFFDRVNLPFFLIATLITVWPADVLSVIRSRCSKRN